MSKDGQPEAWLGGRLYFAHSDTALTLEELYALDYSESYMIPDIDFDSAPFSFMAKINYASYKGYRLYNFVALQQWDDFAGNDFMEANAFLATLFKQYIGPKQVEKWNVDGDFVDKYGVNDIIMEHFTIEHDNDENISLHTSLRDDLDWNGFPEKR